MDNSEEFVYRRDGEEAEVVVLAPDAEMAERGFRRASAAAMLPGAESPVWAVSSHGLYGHSMVSGERVAPALASPPGRGMLLSTEASAASLARSLGFPPDAVGTELVRRLLEARFALPRSGRRGVREACESGAEAAAAMGVIEPEDFALMAPSAADADALGKAALVSGEREWSFFDRPVEVAFHSVADVFDAAGLESLGLEEGGISVEINAGSADLGRRSFALHRERAKERVMSGVFDPVGSTRDPDGLHAFPLDSEETEDSLLASGAASNFADWRASVGLHVVRRALGGILGDVSVLAAWNFGGINVDGDRALHRANLAARDAGEVIVCREEPDKGSDLCTGMGRMYGSAPPVGVEAEDGRWLWEEAGVLGRWARLERHGAVGGEVQNWTF